MPQVKDFRFFQIYIYFDDEGAPHFHVIETEMKAKVRIDDAEVIAGALSVRAARRIRRWYRDENPREFLMKKWREYSG